MDTICLTLTVFGNEVIVLIIMVLLRNLPQLLFLKQLLTHAEVLVVSCTSIISHPFVAATNS